MRSESSRLVPRLWSTEPLQHTEVNEGIVVRTSRSSSKTKTSFVTCRSTLRILWGLVSTAHIWTGHTVCATRNRYGSSTSTTMSTAAYKRWWNDRRNYAESSALPIHGLFRSIPALSSLRRRIQTNQTSELSENEVFSAENMLQEVAVKVKKPTVTHSTRSRFAGWNQEYFLGITPQTIRPLLHSTTKQNQSGLATSEQNSVSKKRVGLREGMSEALDELRYMRAEMEQMRKELTTLKQLQMGGEYVDPEHEANALLAKARQKRQLQRQFEKVSTEVESWADNLLFPSATDGSTTSSSNQEGWTEIQCNKLLRSKFNRDGRTRVYLAWMKDSRGTSYVTRKPTERLDEQEWPCIRLYSTIDAPCHEVSLYLSNAGNVQNYNQLLDQHKDLEEITPHSKICWAQSPQILFIKPRDFVTYCSHRWRRDGTQVVVNQACDSYGDNSVNANAFAFRGATFIGPDPADPELTRISMLAHASPGKDIPSWACKAAIQSLVPIEPYRLFHKINEGVRQNRDVLQAMARRIDEAEMVGAHANGGAPGNLNSTDGGRTSRRPAGIAQMGYACFWPNGGGVQESASELEPSTAIPNNDENIPISLLNEIDEK